MSAYRQRPLLRFEAQEKAKVVASPSHISATSTVQNTSPMKRKGHGGSRKKRTGGGKRGNSKRFGKKPKVVKGRVQLRVSGYSGVQKIAPSSLIPFLPITKIKAAAKRALLASGKKRTIKRRKTSKKKRS